MKYKPNLFRLQFEELHHPTKPLQFLTSLYDEYLENWIGDYWSQPKHLPPGFKVILQYFFIT